MSNYRQIHTRAWSDTWFCELEPQLKLLFIFLFSNERTSACGLYELPLRSISFQTGMAREEILRGLAVFQQAGKVEYDPHSGVIWVRNMLKYQTSSSPRLKARIQADIRAVPECALKRAALQELAGDGPAQEAPAPEIPPQQVAAGPLTAEVPSEDENDRVSIGYDGPQVTGVQAQQASDRVSIGYGGGGDTSLSLSTPVPVPVSLSGSLSLSGEGVQGEGVSRAPPESAVEVLMPGQEVLRAYQANIGMLTPLITQALLDDEREYGAEWVCAAIQEAVHNEVRSLKYARAILKRWKRDGFRTDRKQPKSGKGQSMQDVKDMLQDWINEEVQP